MSRLVMDELRLAKAKLVKLTSSDNIETVVDEFLDIVKIFESHEITADMIPPKTGLGLGPAVRNFINKIKEGSEAHERGLRLLKTWKNIVTAAKGESSAAPSESKSDEPKPPKLETASFSTSGSAPADLGPPVNIQEAAAVTKPVQDMTSSSSSSGGKNNISNRRAARTVLLTAFKTIPSVVAEKVVSSIELALDKAFSDKEYSSKYRSLAANLKKNKALLQNVVSGAIAPHELIRLTPAELASETIRETREKIVKDQASGRSMNWADENREKIYEQLGLDPNNAWIYDDEEDGLSEPDIETGDA